MCFNDYHTKIPETMKATIKLLLRKSVCYLLVLFSKFKPLYFGDNNLCKKEERKKTGNTLS